jgi:outer membrane protein OmpA-like peptidoglycan-associated protein
MKLKATTIVTLAGLTLVGCASSPPKELSDARAAYNRAASGPAAEVNPAQLHVAKQTLVLAEQTFDDEGDSFRAKDRAYVAMRKAQLAEVQARILQADKESAQWRHQAEVSEARMIARSRNEASKAKEELASERQRREDAERNAQEAYDKLAKFGKVTADDRGTVISLSGSLLFASGKSALMPTAKSRLKEVADAIIQNDRDAQLLVEGHTDSTGSAQLNDALSLKRAESVRSYLVSKGIPRQQIEAQGFGFSRPIADNSTPEGRANNRRVEIVVQNPVAPSGPGTGSMNMPSTTPGSGLTSPQPVRPELPSTPPSQNMPKKMPNPTR